MVAFEMAFTLLVLVVAIVLFATELLPVPVTALGCAAALMLGNVITPEQGFSGFSNEATMTVLCMLIMAAAIQRTGVVATWAEWMIQAAGGSEKRFLLILIVITGLLSAPTNNTPQVALMIPLVVATATRLGKSPSRFLIPMAYASTLGGMLMLIGTSTNILASSVSEQQGTGRFSMFEFTLVGAAVFAVGGLYLYLAAPRLLKDRVPAKAEERFDLKEYLCEVLVQEGSGMVGERLGESDLQKRFDVLVLRLVRDDYNLEWPGPSTVLQPGDILLVRGSRVEMLKIHKDPKVTLLPEVTHWLPGKGSQLEVVEAIIPPGSFLAGSSLADVRFRGRFDAVVLGVRKRARLFPAPLANVRLEPGDSLLLLGTRPALAALKQEPSILIPQEVGGEVPRRHRIPHVLGIFAAVIVAGSLEIVPLHVAALAGVVLMVVTGGLRVQEFQEAVRWDVVFLLAGLIPLGVALKESGAAAALASWLAVQVVDWQPVFILGVVYLVTLALTEIMSNNATVALMIPFSVELAAALGLNPMPFVVACTFGASLAFMTPVGYQTYLMVYGPGGYRFMDFVKVGLPLNLICMVVAVPLLDHFWPLQAA